MASYEEIANEKKEEYKKLMSEQAQQKIDQINSAYNTAISKAENDTADQIAGTEDDYLDIVRSAEIQKELDLRDIRETRANMGLARSGLSATEQTAAVLSAGNKTAEAQRQKQKAIDSLNKALLEYKTATESDRHADILKVEQDRDAAVLDNANQWDNWVIENNQADEEARIAAQKSAETQRRSDLDALKEAGTITPETYGYALVNGLSTNQAVAYNELSRVVDSGLATEREAVEVIQKGYTPQYAVALLTAKNKLETSGRRAAATYLRDNLDINEEEIVNIMAEIGLEGKDFENLSVTETVSQVIGDGQSRTTTTKQSASLGSPSTLSSKPITIAGDKEPTFWSHLVKVLGIS